MGRVCASYLLSKAVVDSYFYICSSARHIFLAMGLANGLPNIRHHLLVINQKAVSPVVGTLLSRPEPFTTVEAFVVNGGGYKKLWGKKRSFARLKELIDSLQPVRIFGGNDRREEFQYAVSYAEKYTPQVVGAYLDDGTGSYVNGVYLRKWRAIVDLTVDRLLKRVFYGPWYDKQRLLGGTRWVKECYLNFPDLAPEELKSRKDIFPLEREVFRADSLRRLLESLVDAYRTPSDEDFSVAQLYQEYDVFVVLPHSKAVARYFGGEKSYNEALGKYLKGKGKVAVKYHPRESRFYFDCDASVTVFPASLPAEILFSFVQSKCVVGDMSSALLSAAWLMPESRTICLCPRGLDENPILSLVKRVPPVEIVYS